MKQPDLGLKVTDLRQQKGLTQEQLAEKCEVSARTIQRIESGEVDPRSYTLQCLSTALDFDFAKDDVGNENLWLVVLHLSNVIPLLITPLVIWSWKKDSSYKIDQQGRAVLNFQITILLLLFLGGFLLIFLPVFLPMLVRALGDVTVHLGLFEIMILCAVIPIILVGIFSTYQGVVNTVRAISGKPIHYPLSIPFVK